MVLNSAWNATHNFPLLLSSALHMAVEDPVHFAIQIVRRTPHQIRDSLSSLPIPQQTGSALTLLWALMLDRPDLINNSAIAEDTALPSLRNRIFLQQGIAPPSSSSANDRARYAWEIGNVSRAMELSSGHLHRRLAAHLKVLTPGMHIDFQRSPAFSDLLTAHTPPPANPGSIRVLHALVNSLPWTQSGYSLRSHSLLTAQRDAGLDVTALTRPAYPVTVGFFHASKMDIIDGIPYKRILPHALPRFEDQRIVFHAEEIIRQAQLHNANILHTTTPFTNALAVDAAARALKIPWVYEMRGELEKSWVARHPHHLQQAVEASARYQLMRARETECAQRAHAVIALSEVQRSSLVERGVREDRITVIPNAVDEKLLAIPRNVKKARQALGLPRDGFWVGSVSSLVDYEGLDTLIRAVARLARTGSNIRCALVGDGVSRSQIKALIDELDLNERVVLPGRVPSHEAITWYSALDVMVIPRKDTAVTRAVTPMKGLQAMALGIPQVVSDLPALTEVGSAAGQGIAVPPGDEGALANVLRQLQRSHSLRNSLSEAARAEARQRTWNANGQKYSKVYRTLL